VLDEELDGYEQERNEALAMGDDDAARYYDGLAQENMAEQESWNCDATPMPGPVPGQMIDDVRETLAPQLELDHVDRGSDLLDRGAVGIDRSLGLVSRRP
jgi:hypothetical protein